MSEEIEEMSLAEVISKAEGLKPEVVPIPEPPPQQVASPVTPDPSPAAGENLGPFLKTPEPDPSWPLETAQAHEAKIQEDAFNLLKKLLLEQSISYEEVPSQPFTMKVGDLTVQNIILPWEADPRVVAFKGIRIICPDYLDQRVDAFRRKRRNGPFNFQGLIARIQMRLRLVREFSEKEKSLRETQAKLLKIQEEELAGVKIPLGLTLSRNEGGTYSGSVAFSSLPLTSLKDLIKLLS